MKTSPNGIQGLAMIAPVAPVVGFPLGVHALSGALLSVAGLAVAVAPIALPVLYNTASNGGFESLIGKLAPALQGVVGKPRAVAAVETASNAADKTPDPSSQPGVQAGDQTQ